MRTLLRVSKLRLYNLWQRSILPEHVDARFRLVGQSARVGIGQFRQVFRAMV